MNGQPHPESFGAACRSIARRFGVDPEIHPDDHVFRFSADAAAGPDEACIFGYFKGGEETAANLRKTLREHRPVDEPFSLLEFAAGYGRVTRHLRRFLPAAHVVACDIHDEAVRFLRRMGCEAVLSSPVPENLQTGRRFDVVYALSFFSHMPKRTWARWLSALADQLVPGGHLVFTTHGEAALDRLGSARLGPDGFWFTAFSEQKDLCPADYGAAATSVDFVQRQIAANDLRLLRFADAGMGYQDLYVVAKRASPAG
jgi:SAM-dependent methyltransferase